MDLIDVGIIVAADTGAPMRSHTLAFEKRNVRAKAAARRAMPMNRVRWRYRNLTGIKRPRWFAIDRHEALTDSGNQNLSKTMLVPCGPGSGRERGRRRVQSRWILGHDELIKKNLLGEILSESN